MSRKQRNLVSLVLFALLLSFAWTAAAEVERDSTETVALDDGGRISLENINGDVEVVAWDRSEVEVRYRLRGKSEESLERVDVIVEKTNDHVSIGTEYKQGRYNDAASVDFTLRVPRGANLEDFELVNGALRVTGVAGSVRADLVNGAVTLRELGGDVKMTTVNGSIDVELVRLEADQKVRLESVNGSLEVSLPAGVNADVEAETVHGRIENDFGLEVKQDGYVGRSLRGKVGSGGPRVQLENVNGSITIRRN
jgi:DUF4097 and DUF4098 domain-containing protein YvlB